jgi:EmrB/QacA subfamily drug resistance transporter
MRNPDTTVTPRRTGLVLAMLCAADFLVVLDGLIVAVALPVMQRDLGIAPGSLQWVVNAYVLCFGGFLLLGGRLGDLYGRRRVLLAGLMLFAMGAVLAGLAPNPAVLIAGRALQGLGAALMAPAALALLVAAFPAGAARNRALGLWSAAGSIGIPAGALLGGLFTTAFGWRWVLLVNVPVAVLAAVGTRVFVAESTDADAPRRLDLPGAGLVTAGLSLLVFAIVQAEHAEDAAGLAAQVLIPGVAAVALLAGFLAVEHRTAQPLIPLSALRGPGLTAANLTAAVLPVGLGAVLFVGTLHLQRVVGLNPLHTGLAYLALAAPVITASPMASRLITRCGRRPTAVAGLLLQAAGLVLLAGVPEAGEAWAVLPGFLAVGVGAPLAFVPTTAAAMGTGSAQPGLASGVFNTAQQAGNAVALAAIATLATACTASELAAGAAAPAALTTGHRAGFLLAAVLVLAGTATALRLPPRDTPGRR